MNAEMLGKSEKTCELCGAAVRIVGHTTKSYKRVNVEVSKNELEKIRDVLLSVHSIFKSEQDEAISIIEEWLNK
jgi:hypothetical protein